MTLTGEEMLARALGRRAFLRGSLTLSAAAAAAYALACGGGSDDADATATPGTTPIAGATGTPAGEQGIRPSLLTGEFVINQNNRFLVGLLGPDGTLVENATVQLGFYKIEEDGVTGTFRKGGEATFLKLSIPEAHEHDSTSGDLADDTDISFYGATTPFDESGKWGVEIIATPADNSAPTKVQLPFNVLDTFTTPANGSQAPKSTHDTVDTTTNKESLCSRDPQCDLHKLVIGDVAGKGRPLVVQFSTPAYCQTRFCGPVLEVLLDKVDEYSDRIDFIHIEVWQDFQTRIARPVVGEWHLPSEPYTFFIRPDGTVAGRLEAIFTTEELVAKLEDLLQA